MRTALRIIGYAAWVVVQVTFAAIFALALFALAFGCHCPTCPRDGRDYITVPHE